MSRESDDNLSSINSAYTDLYQETVKRFTRSSLSPTSDWERRSLRSTKSRTSTPLSDNERRTSYDYYLEATGRRRSSDHNSAVLTANTEQFIIGQRVWVGGIRPGQIAYIGETHFAPGDWAGIVLDEPNGKNDGCVSGKRYFQCEPKRGIFSRLTRLTVYPMSGAVTPTSPLAKHSPERSRTVSPTASLRSSMLRSPGTGKNGLTVGDRVIVSSGFGSRPGLLRYLGETQFAPGNWCGVELDEASGKNDGAVDGIRYFDCKPKYGVFVPIAKVSLSPSMKKTRLSRTGSRESLTSIGTMNSIATTNTSRMRMNAQQRKSSTPIRPIVTSPKSQFSMQDLLREKQHHVEQLMVERELDREDAQNQALQLQKNINELKARIVHLENQLGDERKKSEELQFSIDEAQFCGDELNAQSQVYKEKIHDLEKKITQLVSDSPSLQSISAPAEESAALATAQAQIAELTEKLNTQEKQNEARFAELQDEEQRLLESIKYLQSENETLQTELVGKDENLEKFSLSESGIENLRRELALLKEENEKQTQQAQADFDQKLASKTEQLEKITAELNKLKSASDALESERENVTDECEILQTEIKMRDEQIKELGQQVDELKMQLSVQKADSSALDEMLTAQTLGSAESKTALAEKITENGQLKLANESLERGKTELEQQLGTISAELNALKKQQKTVEEQLKASSEVNNQKQIAVEEHGKQLQSLQTQLLEEQAKNTALAEQLNTLNQSQGEAQQSSEQLRQQLEEKEKKLAEHTKQAEIYELTLKETQVELDSLQKQAAASKEESAKELARLNEELTQLRASLSQTESESSNASSAMSARLTELEAQKKQLEEHLQQVEQTAKQTQEQHMSLQAKYEEQTKQLANSNETLESTNATLTKLSQEHEIVKANCVQLEAQLKHSGESCAQRELELGDMTRKHEALQAKCEALSQQQDTLQAELLAARASSSELQQSFKQLNEELQTKLNSYAELQSQSNSQCMQLTSDNELLQQANIKLERELGECKETLSKLKADISEKEAQLTKLEEQTIKQELALSDASRQQENLQARCEGLVQQNETLQQQLTTLHTTSTDSNAELVKLAQDVVNKQKAFEELSAKSSDERAALEGQLQASQQRIDALCSQVELLTQELKSSTEQNTQLNATLKTEQELSGKQSLELSDALRKLEALNAKCAQQEQAHAKLEQDLSLTRNSGSELNTLLVQLTEQLAAAQKELASQADARSAERLQLERELQETRQQLQASQAEALQLQAELVSATEAKSLQATQFASLKSELTSKAHNELAEKQANEAAARERIVVDFEARLQAAEGQKTALEENVNRLQSELKQAQEQFSKSQLDSKTREQELQQQISARDQAQQELHNELNTLQNSGLAANDAYTELLKIKTNLELELKAKTEALAQAQSEHTQLQLQQSNGSEEFVKLQEKFKELEERLDITNMELTHKEKMAQEDGVKIADLKKLVEAIQVANANISATNAELSTVLEVLQAEKSETAHIFELFEMEADMNAERLLEKLTGMKQELQQTHVQLEAQQENCTDLQQKLKASTTELEQLQQSEQDLRAASLESTEKLRELQQANVELQKALQQKQELLEKGNEFDARLAEYQKVIDEMDDSGTEKNKLLDQLKIRISELEVALHAAQEAQRATQLECTNLARKLQSVELEKTLMATHAPSNGTISNLGGGDENLDTETSLAKINFLNSIIADMQQKNDALKAKVQTLEMLPTDFTKPHAFDMLIKRQPAPRLFCDICDEFDKHETEDCPLQASDERDYSPPPTATEANNNEKKQRKLPAPRKYCDSCEVFGHDTGECADDETY